MDHTQPEPFTYPDPDGDTLTIATTTRFGSTALSLRVQRPDVPEAAAAVHVPLADVERVVAAIRTAAGAVQPDTTTADKAAALGMAPDEYRQHRHQAAVKQIQEAAKGLLAETGLRVMDALEHPVAAGAQQPEAEERRERTEPWGEISGEFGTARQEINRLGSENARLRSQLDALREVSRQQNVRLRAELGQARELLDDRRETERDHAKGDHGYCGAECEVEMPSEHLRNFILAKGYPGTGGALDELLRRAGQSRGTTGQNAMSDAVNALKHTLVTEYCTCGMTPASSSGCPVHGDSAPAREQGPTAGDVVAYRSAGGRILRCLKHAPGDPESSELTPVTSEDLEDGGICTYPDCGVDVLITGGPTA